MSKKDCELNHSRNLSTSYKRDNYYYDIERSKATAKQVKFYRSLWYKFKDNGLDMNEELDKRNIPRSLVTNPTGRCGFSEAINYMINILTELGLYETKTEKQGEFVNTYVSVVDGGGKIQRSWQQIEYEKRGE